MHSNPSRISRFWRELKRRKVIQVIIVYATVFYVVIELLDNITEPLQLPDWTSTFIIVLLAAGFPFAIIFSWIYDITSKGIVKTEPEAKEEQTKDQLPERQSIPGENSIVVLPFQDMSQEKDQDYFCDGITEEIINALTHIQSLKVIARTSAFAFKGKYEDIRKIGRELDVDTILEGSVRKAGNRLRITAQLIRVSDGSHLWSERYDREMKDVFEIQDEISLAIVDKLKIQLFEAEKAKILKSQTSNLEAYSHYLRGRYHWNKRTKEGLEESIIHFKKAIEADPDYALAYTGLADAYCTLSDWGYMLTKDSLPNAKEMVLKSLDIDNTLGETYNTLAYINSFFEWNWKDAEKNFSKALELNPNYPTAHQWYAIYLSATGNHERAIQHVSKARELDPLSMVMYIASGWIHYHAHQFDESIKHLQKVITINKNIGFAYLFLSEIHLQQGRHGEFIKEYQNMLSADPLTEKYVPVVEDIFKKSGLEGFTEWLTREEITITKETYNMPTYLAIYCATLGETEQAFKWIEQGIEIKSMRMVAGLKVDPAYDNLRSDPRFIKILDRVGYDN